MIKTMQRRINVDVRGKITCGQKSEKGYPQSLPRFNVSKFRELVDVYGPNPSQLILYFPSDNIIDFFDANFVAWGTNSKKRQCDGETCVHRIDETVGGQKYAAGEETPCICKNLDGKDKNRCRCECYLKAWIASPITGKPISTTCYLFLTHSENSASSVLCELEKIKGMMAIDNREGFLRGIPFCLSVKMSRGKTPGSRYPLWSLQLIPGLTFEKMQTLKGAYQNFSRPLNMIQSKQPAELTDNVTGEENF